MSLFSRPAPPEPPIPGHDYLLTLHKYLRANLPRLAPTAPPPATLLQQSYTLLTLGLDPNSQPLSRSLKVPLTLGFGSPGQARGPVKPLLLRLPPDRLLYLLLRWQALPQQLAHVGRTDVPIAEGVPYAARGATDRDRGEGPSGSGKGKERAMDGDVQSVRSWVGSMRSVSMGSMGMGSLAGGWFAKEQPSEDQILLGLYSMFTVLPALLIHPPYFSDPPIADLVDVGGYTQLGGIDVRVPLDILRNLTILELEGYDPRALLIPCSPNIRNLTVKDVQDADDWIEELLIADPDTSTPDTTPDTSPPPRPRFPNLRHLCLQRTSLLSLPTLPLSRLTSLDLSHNLLNAIPPALSSLSSLASLNLSHNLITSLRNSPSALGNVAALNLAHNRIDCLVGLERVLGLQRVDVRHNEIAEHGEVGRLAVLPTIQAVWCAGNELEGEDGWRVRLGTTFAMEGREVVVDDAPFSWNEQRAIDNELAASGRRRRPTHTRQPTVPAPPPSASASTQAPTPPSLSPALSAQRQQQAALGAGSSISPLPHRAPAFSRSNGPSPALAPQRLRTDLGPSTSSSAHSRQTSVGSAISAPAAGGSAPHSPSIPGSSVRAKHKRRPRRVINLDSNEGLAPGDGGVIGGSMRLPPKSKMVDTLEGAVDDDGVKANGNGVEAGTGTGAGVRAGEVVGNGDGVGSGKHGAGAGTGMEGQPGEDGVAQVQGVKVVSKRGGRRARVSASMFEPH